MIVPNFIPGPEEVAANVSMEPYGLRVAFIRRVMLLHFGSAGIVAVLMQLPFPAVGTRLAGFALALVLVVLAVQRILQRGGRSEASVASACLVVLLPAVAWFVHEIRYTGIPIWAPAVGLGAMLLYTLLCGRDFSFVGCFSLALVVSSVAIALLCRTHQLTGWTSGRALTLNAAALLFWTYDLGYLMARRRRGEELAAVTDLYRDVLNVFGYIPRVILHWRRHRIWSRPDGWHAK
ncbi:MAG: hypothetical protein ACOYON_12600 [Fimbriimonas sp.]